MKVLLINGSPHPKGCTFTALSTVAAQLEKNGVESELIQIGSKAIRGCIACGKCKDTGYCVFKDDPVNEVIDLLRAADGVAHADSGGSESVEQAAPRTRGGR